MPPKLNHTCCDHHSISTLSCWAVWGGSKSNTHVGFSFSLTCSSYAYCGVHINADHIDIELHNHKCTVAYNCHSMKQFSWVTCYKTAVWPMTKRFSNLTYGKTAVWPMTKQFSNFTYDKNTVWPMINLQLDLWQNYSLTYGKNKV